MPDLRAARFAFFVSFCALVSVPRLALAGPPVALGTLEVRGTRAIPLPVVVMRSQAPVPAPALARLPPTARAPYVEQQRATAEKAQIVRAMRAHGVSGSAYGPTLRDIVQRAQAARSRLRRALEQGGAALEAEGWLLLAELRLEDLNERLASSGEVPTPTALAPVREAYAQAAALGGMRDAGLWARLRESALAAGVGDFAAAQSGLDVVIANAPRGPLRAVALVEQADLDDGPGAERLYARALTEGADAPLRAYIHFASMIGDRFRDPTAARDAGISILAEGDDATAEGAAPIVGELLFRTGDPGGMSVPTAVAPERAARALVAAGEAALGAGERAWAELALRAATERAASGPAGRAAAARLASVSAAPEAPSETVSRWLVRQAARCQSDALSVDARSATGELDVLVRRQRGLVRVVARVRPGAGAGAARFERCIEGVLPDPPALDASTIYQGALRLR